MSADRFAEIERLYHEAMRRRPEERVAFLDEACGGDDALRHEVESLLSLPTDADGFLSRPALEEAARAGHRPWEPYSWPTIPGYTLKRVLGEGGMGVVYLAEQETPFRRLVALKLIKPGMDTRQVVARFETERQALALMDHPNIAAVFDAGSTDDGRPYFIMEFVEGVTITDYCDRGRLSTRDRLALFVQVCAAVQHAHQKGVIHRDLKPSNVLVTDRDGHALPKVIDFGTAKAVGGAWNATATQAGQGMVLGTLEYMSPEQAALSADIDTATDVYSLGVLLYELLVGRLPFDADELRAAGYDEIRRVIRESDPPKPSVRVEQRSDKSGPAARARQTDAPGLTRQLRGDLDWITLKALEKDRTRRYATVAAFATDIGRFLGDQPVDARPPSSAYRIRKFTRRHRGAVIGVAAVILALMAGLAASLTQYGRAEGQRREAERFAAVATAEAEYRAYVATISAADAELRLNLNTAARDRLLTVPVALRAWEWQHLFLKADTSLVTFTSTTPCVRPGESARNPDMILWSDNVLAVGGASRRIYLRRCEILEVWQEPGYLHSAYRASGLVLALGAAGEALILEPMRSSRPAGWIVRLIDPSTGDSLHQFGPFTAEPSCADLSPDGTRLAIGLKPASGSVGGPLDEFFDVWEVQAERRLLRLAPSRPPQIDTRLRAHISCAVAFSPDSTRLATSGSRLHIWRSDSGAEVAADVTQAGIVAQPIAWSPDGLRVAVGRRTGLVDILNLTASPRLEHLDGNGLIRVLPAPIGADWPFVVLYRRTGEVRTVAFSADGTRLLTSAGRGIGIWDVALGKLTRVLYGHSSPVIGAVGNATGQIISTDLGGQVKVWPASLAGAVTVLPAPISDFVLSADGSTVGLAQTLGRISVVRLTDMQESVLREPSKQESDRQWADVMAISPDGRFLLSSEGDEVGTVRMWAVQSKTSVARPTLAEIPGCEPARNNVREYALFSMAISPDGQSFAHGQGRCTIVRDMATWAVIAVLHEPTNSLVFRPDGSLVLASQIPYHGSEIHEPRPTKVLIWDWRRNVMRAEAPVPTSGEIGAWHIVTSADGRVVALTSRTSGAAWIWKDDLRGEPRRLAMQPGTDRVALNSDGSRLASSDWDSTVRVWDVERGQLVLNLPDDDLHHYGLGFTPDGRLVVGRASGGLTIFEPRKR